MATEQKQESIFCKDHTKVLWYACYTALHINCSCEEIIDWKDVKEWINIIRNLFDQILINSKLYSINEHIKDFSLDIKTFIDSLTLLEEKVRYFE